MDGVRFSSNTPFGFGEGDCLVAIDDVDIRKKSKDEISKLLNKENLEDFNDIFKLTIVRKSHPDQSSIIVGNEKVDNACFLVVHILQLSCCFLQIPPKDKKCGFCHFPSCPSIKDNL